MGDLVITEQAVDDFDNAVGSPFQYIRIAAPTDFEFKANAGNISFTGAADITATPIADAPIITVFAAFLEVRFKVNDESEINSLTIENLQVRAVNAQNSGIMNNITSPSGTNAIPLGLSFGNLASIESPTINTQPTTELICQGENGSLMVVASGSGLSYQWQRDAGSGFENIDILTDGAIYSNFNSAALQIINAPNTINGYSYQVVITGACLPLLISDVTNVGITPTPVSPSTTNQTQTICENEAIALPVASGSGGTYSWYADASLNTLLTTGATPSAADLGFDNTTAGTTIVYLTETTGPLSCESPATVVTLNVKALPNNTLAVTTSSTAVCDGGSLIFTIASSQSGVNYQLFDESNNPVSNTFGGNGGNLSFPTYALNFASLGSSEDITVRAANSSTSCQDNLTAVQTLTIAENPTTAIAGTDINQCANASFNLSANTPTTGSGLWTVVSGSATIASPTVANTAVNGVPAGTSATLRWTISNGTCAASFDELVLTNKVAPIFDPVPANISICTGELVNISFSTISGTDNITWSANNALAGNTLSGAANLNFIAGSNNSGSDVLTTVTVSASNSICTSPTVTTFTIRLHPTPDIISFFPPTDVCQDETTTDLNALGLNANPAGGTFTFSGAGVTGSNFDATAVGLGVHEIDVTYQTANSCTITERINLLNIIAPPTADAGTATDEVCVNTTYTVADAAVTNSAGILWTHDGSGALSDETTTAPIYTPALADAGSTVTLTLTVSGNGSCADATDTKVLTITTAPTADAGAATDEVCVNTTYTVADAAVTNSAGILWST